MPPTTHTGSFDKKSIQALFDRAGKPSTDESAIIRAASIKRRRPARRRRTGPVGAAERLRRQLVAPALQEAQSQATREATRRKELEEQQRQRKRKHTGRRQQKKARKSPSKLRPEVDDPQVGAAAEAGPGAGAPGGAVEWTERWDEEHGFPYFTRALTGESRWATKEEAERIMDRREAEAEARRRELLEESGAAGAGGAGTDEYLDRMQRRLFIAPNESRFTIFVSLEKLRKIFDYMVKETRADGDSPEPPGDGAATDDRGDDDGDGGLLVADLENSLRGKGRAGRGTVRLVRRFSSRSMLDDFAAPGGAAGSSDRGSGAGSPAPQGHEAHEAQDGEHVDKLTRPKGLRLFVGAIRAMFQSGALSAADAQEESVPTDADLAPSLRDVDNLFAILDADEAGRVGRDSLARGIATNPRARMLVLGSALMRPLLVPSSEEFERCWAALDAEGQGSGAIDQGAWRAFFAKEGHRRRKRRRERRASTTAQPGDDPAPAGDFDDLDEDAIRREEARQFLRAAARRGRLLAEDGDGGGGGDAPGGGGNRVEWKRTTRVTFPEFCAAVETAFGVRALPERERARRQAAVDEARNFLHVVAADARAQAHAAADAEARADAAAHAEARARAAGFLRAQVAEGRRRDAYDRRMSRPGLAAEAEEEEEDVVRDSPGPLLPQFGIRPDSKARPPPGAAAARGAPVEQPLKHGADSPVF